MAYSPFEFMRRMREMRDREHEMSAQNPHLAAALLQDKMEGHRLAVIARTVAMVTIMCLLRNCPRASGISSIWGPASYCLVDCHIQLYWQQRQSQ